MYAWTKFRSVTSVLMIALSIFITLPSSRVEATSIFSDLSASHDNYEAIIYLKNEGVINGYSDGTFKPENTVNRAELLKILVGGTGSAPTVEDYNNCFPDVEEEWYAPYVCYAKNEGWVSGYPDGTFKPEQEVNKVEAVKMLVNSQGYEIDEKTEDQSYSDVNSDEWYAPYVENAKEKGLLEETGDYFGPDESMTRGGISENIYRAMIIEAYALTSFDDYSVISTTVGADDQVNTPNRLWTVNEVEIVDDPYGLYTSDEANKLVGIYLTNQNISEETMSFSDVELLVKDSDGNEYSPTASPKEPELTGGILDPDEERSGWVTFEVPEELIEAELVFLVTNDDGTIERIKKPITLPEVTSSEEEVSSIYEQSDIVEFDGFEWEILGVYLVDTVGSESYPQYPQNDHFLLIEAELKNISDEAKYNGDPVLMIGDQQIDHSVTAEVYGKYFFNYDSKISPFEAGARAKTFFGFDVPEIEGEELTLILKSWSVSDDRAKINLSDVQEE